MSLSTTSSARTSGVLQSNRRKHSGRNVALSDSQVLQHGRGAQTLRNHSLFDATIPFGFTSLVDPMPSPGPSSMPKAGRPLSPLFIQEVAASEAPSQGMFVFARAAHTPSSTPPIEPPSAAILEAFLPLPMPPHLSPRVSPATSGTSWHATSSTSPPRPTMSRSVSAYSVKSTASSKSTVSSSASSINTMRGSIKTMRPTMRPTMSYQTNPKMDRENEKISLSELLFSADVS